MCLWKVIQSIPKEYAEPRGIFKVINKNRDEIIGGGKEFDPKFTYSKELVDYRLGNPYLNNDFLEEMIIYLKRGKFIWEWVRDYYDGNDVASAAECYFNDVWGWSLYFVILLEDYGDLKLDVAFIEHYEETKGVEINFSNLDLERLGHQFYLDLQQNRVKGDKVY